jgi:phage baseplate assembly protein gpV
MNAFDKSTSYWLEVDTKNKSVKFHTAMNDGEYTEYDITINTKDGTLKVTDKKNNYIYLESKKDTITVNTNKDIIAKASASVTVNAPNINLTGNVNITGNVKVNGSIHASGSIIDLSGNTPNHSH